MKKTDMIQVQEYEENQKFSDYMLGIAALRDHRNHNHKQSTENSQSEEEEEDEFSSVRNIVRTFRLLTFFLEMG